MGSDENDNQRIKVIVLEFDDVPEEQIPEPLKEYRGAGQRVPLIAADELLSQLTELAADDEKGTITIRDVERLLQDPDKQRVRISGFRR